MLKRASHVIGEISRCKDAALALQKNDYGKMGKLMKQSHDSLRDLFEVSCPELDELQSLLINSEGVYGARMTGGGFGGCVVAMVENTNLEAVVQHLEDNYSGKATYYVALPSDGARELQI